MIDVVLGGQYGSEGKGKVVNYLAGKNSYHAFVRVGGPNSGHTCFYQGKKYVFRCLPCALNSRNKDIILVLPVGSYIRKDILKREIQIYKMLGFNPAVLIDRHAVIITNKCVKREKLSGLTDTISSTGTGIGYAVSQRVNRNKKDNCSFACNHHDLKDHMVDTKSWFMTNLLSRKDFLVEGTQGYGLSILSENWPYVTARDTSLTGILSEAGISPTWLRDVYMVLRTYPIRVGGNSGPMENEITWDKIAEVLNKPGYCEKTTVTNKVRRVGLFDYDAVIEANFVNSPTNIVMNFMDYFTEEQAQHFVRYFEDRLGRRIDYFGSDETTIVRREEYGLD